MMYTKIIILIFIVFVSIIDSRRNLRDYVVSHNYLSATTREEFSVYDQSEKNILCRLESASKYTFNQLTNLITYCVSCHIKKHKPIRYS